MFPRDRVIASLKKYQIPYEETASDEQLRTLVGVCRAEEGDRQRYVQHQCNAEADLR